MHVLAHTSVHRHGGPVAGDGGDGTPYGHRLPPIHIATPEDSGRQSLRPPRSPPPSTLRRCTQGTPVGLGEPVLCQETGALPPARSQAACKARWAASLCAARLCAGRTY